MKKLLLILGITNFIAIETSLIISCSSKLTKSIKWTTNSNQCGNSCELEFSNIYNSFLIPSKIGGGAKIKFQDNIDLPLEIKKTRIFSLSLGNKNKDWINFYKNNGVKKTYDDFSYLDLNFGYEISEIINVKITFTKSIGLSYSITSFFAEMPPLPEKDNEQPIPRANHFKI